MSTHITAGRRSEQGRRSKQEDACATVKTSGGRHALVVADGMGGHGHGELAASLAVKAAVDVALDVSWPSALESVRLVARAADDAILRLEPRQPRDPSRRSGPGSTLTAAYVDGSGVALCVHIGDSRLWLIRREVVTQLTRDHSMKAVVKRMSGEEMGPDWDHVLSRALGNWSLDSDAGDWQLAGDGRRSPYDVFKVQLEPGDRLVLTTDGVHGVLEPSKLSELVCAAEGPQKAAEALVLRALEAGSKDNCTAVVAAFG